MVSEVIRPEYHAALRAVILPEEGLVGMVRFGCSKGCDVQGICAVVGETNHGKVRLDTDLFLFGSKEDIIRTVGYLPRFQNVKTYNNPGNGREAWKGLAHELTFDGNHYAVPLGCLRLRDMKTQVLAALEAETRRALPALVREAINNKTKNMASFGCLPRCLEYAARTGYYRANTRYRISIALPDAYGPLEKTWVRIKAPTLRLQAPVRNDGWCR